MDEPLRNRLWDVLRSLLSRTSSQVEYSNQRMLYCRIWANFYEESLEKVPSYTDDCNSRIRTTFFAGAWHEAHDLLEFVVQNSDEDTESSEKLANTVLEKYLAAYRFVGGQLVEATDEISISAIEVAVDHPLDGVRKHISNALAMIGDRKNPDLANSIKESISAVESLCSAIIGKKTTLGGALKCLKGAGVEIHAALVKSWEAQYGWTSDADGIRHAMQSDPNLTVADAAYFLVSCSAFVSLLTDKAQVAGIELKPIEA